MKIPIQKCLGLVLFFLGGIYAQAQEATALVHSPTVSDTNVAFIYAEDLWVANLDGSNPIRLTIDEGVESNPVFSPDGKTIAFTGNYDGNQDVFVVSATGGTPKRLTYHPGADFVLDFTPDGSKVLFGSQRTIHTRRYAQLFEVSIDGGAISKLDIPNAFWADYSDDGSHIAYTPIRDVFPMWKHYRGGTIARIWLYNKSNHKVEEIPKIAGGNNDTSPVWMGDTVYFKSDRAGEFNLYSFNTTSKELSQLTNFTDFPVLDVDARNGNIVFEQGGYIHRFNPANNSSSKIPIAINTDLLEVRERFVSGANYVRSGGISPSGARAVIDFRGEIITVPAKKGDYKNMTNSPGAHEKYPSWSNDGKHIAYFSDASGEYQLHVHNTATGNATEIKVNGAGFYFNPHWSPDNKKIAFVDNSRTLFMANVDTKKVTKIASDVLYTPGVMREIFGDWSYDSNWISYTLINDSNFESAYLYNVSSNTSTPLTDGLSNVSEPVFDPSGKYLYMTASTDAGPVVNWFDQSNQDMRASNSIYLVTLQKETISPFKKENDEESTEKDEKKDKPESLRIDLANITNRIVDVPLPPSNYRNLAVAKEGEILYISTKDGKSQISKYTIAKRKDDVIMPANGFEISGNGKKMLTVSGRSWKISDVGAKPKDGPLNFGAIKVKIDPRAEWENIFNEMWRVNRDYFYDPNMHGIDWDAAKTKYAAFLPHVAAKSDLYRVMTWMGSNLGVGHHRFGSRGDRMNNPDRVSGGLLGADYTSVNGRYQVSKIYGGLNWNPNMRSPLTEPGVNVNVGDYIIAVDGANVSSSDNLFKHFENKGNKLVKLTVSSNSNGSNARTYEVTTITNEAALRNRDWVEGNMKKVHEATDGRVAYVYVPNTAFGGHQYFKRYFFPQATKDAIIVDERYNGGGQLADYYIQHLNKPEQARWNFRYGKDLKSPSASIQGPKVLIADENAGSGGDYFPYLWRMFDLGPIVGKRTWGGLVGVLGYPEFIDGGSVTAPNVAFYNQENGFHIENEGVAPDVEVEQYPEFIVKGQDPQLEKAIEMVLEALEKNPPKEVKTPPYPIVPKSN